MVRLPAHLRRASRRPWAAMVAVALGGVLLTGCATGGYDPPQEAAGSVRSFLLDCARDSGTLIPAILNEPAHEAFLKGATTSDGCNRVVALGAANYLRVGELNSAAVDVVRYDESDSATVRVTLSGGESIDVPVESLQGDWRIALPSGSGSFTSG